jgi:hypothetical protein
VTLFICVFSALCARKSHHQYATPFLHQSIILIIIISRSIRNSVSTLADVPGVAGDVRGIDPNRLLRLDEFHARFVDADKSSSGGSSGGGSGGGGAGGHGEGSGNGGGGADAAAAAADAATAHRLHLEELKNISALKELDRVRCAYECFAQRKDEAVAEAAAADTEARREALRAQTNLNLDGDGDGDGNMTFQQGQGYGRQGQGRSSSTGSFQTHSDGEGGGGGGGDGNDGVEGSVIAQAQTLGSMAAKHAAAAHSDAFRQLLNQFDVVSEDLAAMDRTVVSMHAVSEVGGASALVTFIWVLFSVAHSVVRVRL